MTQKHTSRLSASPLIARVWHTQNITDGVYIATPDCAWDLLALQLQDGTRMMMLAGQQTKYLPVPYTAGTSAVVISFTASAYLAGFKGDELVDATIMLPNDTVGRFILLDHAFEFPEYDTAEKLVEAMVSAGILKQDDVVASVLEGRPKAMSSRTMQRHFHEVTGISRKALGKIRRAQDAVAMLQAGTATAEVAAEVGYTDQSHLTKDLKKIMGAGSSATGHIHKL
jgi:hypothetical protein